MPPFPWWKKKSRISRLVADLQSPPKHGGSLVVETGFPTSLIDLVVKNSDRLKKPSKKTKKTEFSGELAISNPVLTSLLPYREYDMITAPSSSASTLTLPSPTSTTAATVASSSVKDETVLERTDLDEKRSSIGGHNCGFDDKNGVGVNGYVNLNGRDRIRVRRLLIAFFKVFLVVVLGLSTKRLVVGLTMSAFLLLFLEYVGGRRYSFLRPCCKSRERLECLFKRVFGWKTGCLDSPKPVLITREEQIILSDSCPSSRDREIESSSGVDEIQVLDSNLDGDVGVRADSGITVFGSESCGGLRGLEGLYSGDDKMKGVAEEDGCNKEILECENPKMTSIDDEDRCRKEILESEDPKPCKKGKLKSKIIKRMVPKKLRPSKKGKKEDGLETRSELVAHPGEDCSTFNERDDNELQKTVCSTGVCEKLQQEKRDYGVEYNSVVSETKPAGLSRDGINSEIVNYGGIEGSSKLKFWVILLVVLAGLLVGRLLPLLLTVVCIVGKVVGRSRR